MNKLKPNVCKFNLPRLGFPRDLSFQAVVPEKGEVFHSFIDSLNGTISTMCPSERLFALSVRQDSTNVRPSVCLLPFQGFFDEMSKKLCVANLYMI